MSDSKNIVQNFRARLRRKGYRKISLVFVGENFRDDALYSFRAFDPLGFPVQAEISDAQMLSWLSRDSIQRGGSIFE